MAPRLALAASLASLALAASLGAPLSGCSSGQGEPPRHAGEPGHAGHMGPMGHRDGASASGPDEALARVAAIHGGNGPWAVAGYRMGQHALARLSLPPQSFDLEVVHHSPRSVQYSCIADGAAAATGASLGKLNLSMVEADEAHTTTTYRKKSTGQALTLRVTQGFAARYRDLPREKLGEAGREVMGLRDDEIFEEVK